MRGDDLVIPKIVDYEIRRGFRIVTASKKEAVYKLLTGPDGWCRVAVLGSGSWERAEHVYAELYRKGLTVGDLDILIAAFCLENNYTFVTSNTKHFKDIDRLLLADWS